MNHRCVRPSTEVRFSVTLSPTSTSIRGPGLVNDVFVNPQPALRLPYRWYVRSRPAATGVARAEATKRRQARLAATAILPRRVDIGTHPVACRRAVPLHKSIGLNGRVVRERTFRGGSPRVG